MSLMSCPWSSVPVISTAEFEQKMIASNNKNIIGHCTLDMKQFAADAKLYSKVARDIVFNGTGHHFMYVVFSFLVITEIDILLSILSNVLHGSMQDMRNTAKEHIQNIRYYCSQDKEHEKESKKKQNAANRDRTKMKRFECDGDLYMKADTESQQLYIRWHHHKHAPYVDVRTQDAVKAYIDEHLDGSTAEKLFADICANSELESTNLTQAQVYSWWRKLSERLWLLDNDQISSALKHIDKHTRLGEVEAINISSINGVCGIGFSINSALRNFASITTEVGIDGTYKTNKKNMELISLITEIDGVGFPLGYALLTASEEISEGAKTHAIENFLSHFKERGISPTFVHTDKDMAEVSAIHTVWPNTKIQLCFWHVLRALKKRLAEASKKTKGYRAKDANMEFDFISTNFVSALTGLEGMPVELVSFPWEIFQTQRQCQRHLKTNKYIFDFSVLVLSKSEPCIDY